MYSIFVLIYTSSTTGFKGYIMKKSRKYVICTIVSMLCFWYVSASHQSAKNHELERVVSSFQQYASTGSCAITLDVEKDWMMGWSPLSMKVRVEKEGASISTVISQFFSPDRIHLASGNTLYRYTWSEGAVGQFVYTAMDFELTSGDHKLKNLRLRQCNGDPTGGDFIGGLEKCEGKIESIKCP